MTDISARVSELRREIDRHNHNYYVLNAPEITDIEFDSMLRELEELERAHPELDDPYSPTHRVGSDLATEFEKAPHIYPMLSLANTYSVEEVDSWVDRMCTSVDMGAEGPELVAEMKFDGVGISLIYENGRLARAVTRGDGAIGDIVTANIMTIRSIPLQLHGTGWPEKFEIRGEIVMPWSAFDGLNRRRSDAGEPLFANPRNAAAGTVKLLNPAEVASRGLDAYFYYLLGENLPADTHYGNMQAARSWGFKVSDAMTPLRGIKAVDDYITYWDDARRRLPVATDGLVFKVNSLPVQQMLGYTAKSPRWAVAYKFHPERALTRLRSVSFDVGRMGTVTPVANLEPVLLSGTVVKRATLHNEDIVRALDIHEHDMLYVEKGGEIIPKITGVDKGARQPQATPVTFVSHCPACGTPLIRVEGESAWVCPNKYGCPPQIVGRIEHFVSRRMMNIDGVGAETARALFDVGLVHSAADLYALKADDFVGLDGFGINSATRAVNGIAASRDVPFDRVLYALSIPYVGETTAKKVARTVRSIDNLMAMPAAQLEAIDDVGPRIAQSIIEYFAQESNRDIVERLRAAGVQMSLPDDTADSGDDAGVLAGKTFVISGVFKHHSRDQYKALIERYGGKNVGSISRKTDYILAGDNMGPSKAEKAASLGIPLLAEDDFLAMLPE